MEREREWQQAGLYDPSIAGSAERLELLVFLAEAGFSVADMVAAERGGRLFALAGDRAIRGGTRTMSLAETAGQLNADLETVEAVWRALGLEEPESSEQPMATPADLQAVQTALMLVEILGTERATSLLRLYGSAMARISDAESAAFRGVADVSVRRSGSELTTARSWFEISHLVDGVGQLLDVTHRHHLDASRRHFEAVGTETALADSDREVRLAVGFIDLSGFTAFSQVLAAEALSELLARFERTVHDVASAYGCRIVKFIGDEVMLVAPACSLLATAAGDVVRDFTDPVPARAGLAFGDVVAREGDYFGVAVNLGARLIAAAEPGTLVATESFAQGLPDGWERHDIGTREFRGFDEPVRVVQITRRVING